MAMKIVLDTHAAYFYVTASQMGATGQSILASLSRDELVISDVTLIELARLIAEGTITLRTHPFEWLEQFASAFTVQPVTPAIAHVAANYTFAHKDPNDRQILATAQVLGLSLITKDRKLTRLAPTVGVRVVW